MVGVVFAVDAVGKCMTGAGSLSANEWNGWAVLHSRGEAIWYLINSYSLGTGLIVCVGLPWLI